MRTGSRATLAACPGAQGAQVDLSDAGATARAIADLVTAPVDALIHNAAILKVEPIDTVTLATFQATRERGHPGGLPADASALAAHEGATAGR